jgi:hypothetical protein
MGKPVIRRGLESPRNRRASSKRGNVTEGESFTDGFDAECHGKVALAE